MSTIDWTQELTEQLDRHWQQQLRPRLNGLTACRNILSDDPDGRILFLSALSDYHDLDPKFSGALAVLQKPIGYALLEQVLNESALERLPAPAATGQAA